MKRRGLNFLTEHHEQNLDMDSINTIEKEVDNIAPKIIGILKLSEIGDTSILRTQMVEYCMQFMDVNQPKKKKQDENMDEGI